MDFTYREEKILKLFSSKMKLSHLDQIKLIYGWRIVIADFKKLFFMYGFALLMGCFIETFLIHASFFLFRQVAFGVHSKNFYLCLIVSCITFPVSSFLLKNLDIGIIHIGIPYLIAAVPLLLFAPIGSAVNPIRGSAHAQYLRRKIYIRLSILGVTILVLPTTITKFLVAGLLIETFTVLVSTIQKESDKE